MITGRSSNAVVERNWGDLAIALQNGWAIRRNHGKEIFYRYEMEMSCRTILLVMSGEGNVLMAFKHFWRDT